MRLMADIICYLCGEVSGRWEWLATTPPLLGIFRALDDGGPCRPRVPLARIRCHRCGGPVFLDAVETVRVRAPGPWGNLDGRRGRPVGQDQPLVGRAWEAFGEGDGKISARAGTGHGTSMGRPAAD